MLHHRKSRKWSNKLQWMPNLLLQIGTGLKYMQFFTLLNSTFSLSLCNLLHPILWWHNSVPSSVVVSIYTHNLFALYCTIFHSVVHTKMLCYEPCSLIHKHRKISIRCYLNFTAEKKTLFCYSVIMFSPSTRKAHEFVMKKREKVCQQKYFSRPSSGTFFSKMGSFQ
jgi:hypothetical protein